MALSLANVIWPRLAIESAKEKMNDAMNKCEIFLDPCNLCNKVYHHHQWRVKWIHIFNKGWTDDLFLSLFLIESAFFLLEIFKS